MNIAIIGYGKMGKAIEEIAISRGHRICLKINSSNKQELNSANLKDVDIAIDFSTPVSAKQNISTVLKECTPIVSGTTGWTNELDEIKALCEQQNTAFIYASNFSLGVNIFFELNHKLAKLMTNHNSYDVSMNETHHIHKLDAPSGTAITLANQILDQNNKTNWTLNKENLKHELYINSIREGEVPGTHTINYSSEVDSISITHKAHNRKGFALGAVIAAEWIADKKGVYTMKDILFS